MPEFVDEESNRPWPTSQTVARSPDGESTRFQLRREDVPLYFSARALRRQVRAERKRNRQWACLARKAEFGELCMVRPRSPTRIAVIDADIFGGRCRIPPRLRSAVCRPGHKGVASGACEKCHRRRCCRACPGRLLKTHLQSDRRSYLPLKVTRGPSYSAGTSTGMGCLKSHR